MLRSTQRNSSFCAFLPRIGAQNGLLFFRFLRFLPISGLIETLHTLRTFKDQCAASWQVADVHSFMRLQKNETGQATAAAVSVSAGRLPSTRPVIALTGLGDAVSVAPEPQGLEGTAACTNAAALTDTDTKSPGSRNPSRGGVNDTPQPEAVLAAKGLQVGVHEFEIRACLPAELVLACLEH